jgi:hypothetical protein
MNKGDTLYIIGNQTFKEFDSATDYADENPYLTLYSVKVGDKISRRERTITKEQRTPKEGIVFTSKEYKYIKDKLKDCKYLVILNKVSYHNRNYIYMYVNPPGYSAAFLDLFKYEYNLYTLDGRNIKFDDIDDFIDYTKERYYNNYKV